MFDWSSQAAHLRFVINFKKIECSSELNELIVRRRIRNIFDLFCLPPNSLNFSDDERRRSSPTDSDQTNAE